MPTIIRPEAIRLGVAHILKTHIADYQRQYPLWPQHRKIVYDMLNCRTEYLGGQIDRCDQCGALRIAYHSCRNRHCPTCQHMPRERWLEQRKREILSTRCFHVVFTLPHTWDQKLGAHFHLHCLVAGGAVSSDGSRWIPCKGDYLFNARALSLMFRGKFMDRMKKACNCQTLKLADHDFNQLKARLYGTPWIVDVRDPVHNPEHVLEYLARYTHRVAIANSRIKALKDGMVTFTYKNRKKARTEALTITAVEFIRRFLLHSLPKRFVRIRHYGFLANRNRSTNLTAIRQLMGVSEPPDHPVTAVEGLLLQLTGIDITVCPCCQKGKMHLFMKIPKGVARPPNPLAFKAA
jgi:hypothetical protein